VKIKEELVGLVRSVRRDDLPKVLAMLEEARAEAMLRLTRFEPLTPPDAGGQTHAGAVQTAAQAPAIRERPRYVRTNEVLAMFGVARSTLWKWRRRGAFPEPVVLGPNVIAWPMEAIERWRAQLPPSACVPGVSPTVSRPGRDEG
jgi:prophage regulatory protein